VEGRQQHAGQRGKLRERPALPTLAKLRWVLQLLQQLLRKDRV
jgi:hypothetical protein